VIGIAMMGLLAASRHWSSFGFQMNNHFFPYGRSTVRSWVRQRTSYSALKNA
jgi:hypothetical protein